MLIHITDVFVTPGLQKTERIQMTEESIAHSETDYPVEFEDAITLEFTNIAHGKAKLKMVGSAVVTIPCDRCLDPVRCTVSVDFEQDVYAPDSIPEEYDEEEQFFLKDYDLDVEALINSEIILNWPMKVVCKSDCKGICPVCGKNRNKTDCGCDTFVPDPRMAAIQGIFNSGKNVK